MSLRDHIAHLRGRSTTRAALAADPVEEPDEDDEEDAEAEGGEEDEDMPHDDKDKPMDGKAAADPADVVAHCVAAGCPAMAETLIREKAPMAEVKARTDVAGAIRQMVAAAQRAKPTIKAQLDTIAAAAIASGLSLDAARAKVFDAMIGAEGPATVSAVGPDASATTAAGWDRAVAKVNGKKAA